jgi:hypothetical protein
MLHFLAKNVEVRRYRLLDGRGNFYDSKSPGTLGGYRRRKVYGRLDCPSAPRWLAKGHYLQHRVFADEKVAQAAGYRPCGVCMQQAYRKWKRTV